LTQILSDIMELTAAIISQESESSKMTITEMKKYFSKVDSLKINHIEITLDSNNTQVLYEGKPLKEYNCVYTKGSFRYAPLLRGLTQIIAKNTYTPISPAAFSIGHDKILTHLALEEAGIPMPKTYLISSVTSAKELLDKINYPIIMKFPHGTQGKGVMVADSRESASSMIDALTALRQPFLIQEFIDTGGVDVRAIVVGDKVVASMKRIAIEGETRSNIHAGGKGEAYSLDANTKKIAIKAAQAVGIDICGVDILESVKGPLVLEINTSPGLQGITEATKVNVAEKIAKYLYEQTKLKMEGEKKTSCENVIEKMGLAATDMQKIITTLDFRGKRILLPELICKIAKFNDEKDVVIKARNGKIEIDNFNM